MFEILRSFERSTASFSPVVLIATGLIAAVLGLVVWLGGMNLGRIPVAFVGAAVGGVCGFLLVGWSVNAIVVCAAAAALVYIVSRKVFFAALVGTIATGVSLCILVGPYMNGTEEPPVSSHRPSPQAKTLSVSESIGTMKAYAIDLGDRIKQASAAMPVRRWAIVAGSTIVLVFAGFFFWRLAWAFSCSVLGTALIFVGLVLLLAFKGSSPITRIGSRASFYGLVFVGMTAFGMIEQRLLCLRAEKKSARDRQRRAIEADHERERTKQSWRSA